MLDGKKTYIAATAIIAFAVLGFLTGKLPSMDAMQALLEGFAIIGIRHAIYKGNY